MMNLKEAYTDFVKAENAKGSNRAPSYIRAIDLLGPILAKDTSKFSDCSNVWAIQSVSIVEDLYEYVLEQQRLGSGGIFKDETPASYWRGRYCSAALKSYKEFLVLQPYREKLWRIFNDQSLGADEIAKHLEEQKIDLIASLVDERNIDFSAREGKEKLRYVKTRVNQDFFRDMLLVIYGAQCCVTGLNIPKVLRASHIIAWKDDKKNRMNPANGLCLSATYDAAFDRYLISFDEDYRMILSPALKEYYGNEAFKTQFLAFEGQRILLPKRYCPDQQFLEKHRERL